MNIAPKIRPRVSFIPIIMNAITSQNPDAGAKKFKAALGQKLVKQLSDNWKRMPGGEKNKRYYLSRSWRAPAGDFATQMAIQHNAFLKAREQLINERKRIIRKELGTAMRKGFYAPTSEIARDMALVYEIQKRWYKKVVGCRCEKPGETLPPPQPPKKYGLIISRLLCHDQRENGSDEIYLVSAVVDGNGKLITTTSPKYNIDDDDNYVLFPNCWIYPMQDPNGFLDAAISMWEDDGGYGQAGQTVAAVGGAISTIPNPYTLAAGVALTVIGEVISLASWLDRDNRYGDACKTWPSKSNLEAGIGPYTLSYYEVDEGLLDDGHDFDLTIYLLSA